MSAASGCSRPSAATAAAGATRYAARRTLHPGADLLTDKQKDRLTALFAVDEHVEVEATRGSTS